MWWNGVHSGNITRKTVFCGTCIVQLMRLMRRRNYESILSIWWLAIAKKLCPFATFIAVNPFGYYILSLLVLTGVKIVHFFLIFHVNLKNWLLEYISRLLIINSFQVEVLQNWIYFSGWIEYFKMKLYALLDGPPSIAVRMVLKALDLPYDLIGMDYSRGEHLREIYSKVKNGLINFQGKYKIFWNCPLDPPTLYSGRTTAESSERGSSSGWWWVCNWWKCCHNAIFVWSICSRKSNLSTRSEGESTCESSNVFQYELLLC